MSPSDKSVFSDYVVACELSKKNEKTLKEAFTSCNENKTSDHSTTVIIGVVTFAAGLLIGALSAKR